VESESGGTRTTLRSLPEPMFRAMLTLFAADSQVLRNLLLMDRPDNNEFRNERRKTGVNLPFK